MKKFNFKKGRTGELTAKRFLEEIGYVFIESNYRCDMGEIDLIMADHDWLVFVEVKTKSDDTNGNPEDMICKQKLTRVVRSSMMYLLDRKIYKDRFEKYRIDAVCIQGGKVRHYKNVYE